MKSKIFKSALSLAISLCITGCETTKQTAHEDLLLPPLADVEVSHNTLTSKVAYRNSDGYFELSGTEDGLTNFTVTRDKADIRDLASFSTALYRRELSPKLKNGEKLSRLELQLLDFCVFTQISAIRAYSFTALQDMLENTASPAPTDNPNFKDITKKIEKNFGEQVRDVSYKMQKDFGKSDSALRKKIAIWGAQFHPIEDKVLVADLFRIQESTHQKIDGFQWRQLWLYVPYVNLITLQWEKDFHETKALRPYKAYKAAPHATAMQWKALNNSMAFHIKDLQSIYGDMEIYLSKVTDSRSRSDIDDFKLETDNDLRSAIMLHSFVFNDLPYSIFCKNAYIEVQNCKYAYKDDEDAMEDVVNKFVVRTNGADMLTQIRSPHTADIYVQFLELIKSEWGDSRYKNYLQKTKLYELDQFSPSYFGKNTVK